MAYAYNTPGSPASNTGQSQTSNGVMDQQPQKVQKSNFQDFNKLLSKNQNTDQGAVNTAVTGKAQQQFASNNAQLQQQSKDYLQGQQSNYVKPLDTNTIQNELKSGGNKLNDLLKGPQYQADKFEAKGITQPQTQQDYSGVLQSNIKPQRQGAFYSQGMANLDAQVFKNSGAQTRANQDIQNQQQAFNQNLNTTANTLQAQATQQGQAAQSEAQAGAKDQLGYIRNTLKQSDMADFNNQMKARQDQQVQDALAKAKAAGSNVTEAQIRNQLGNVGATENYASNENINQENQIANLLGDNTQYSSTIGSGIDSGTQAKIDQLIQSGVPPAQAAALYDPKKQPGYYGQIRAVAPKNPLDGLFKTRSSRI